MCPSPLPTGPGVPLPRLGDWPVKDRGPRRLGSYSRRVGQVVPDIKCVLFASESCLPGLGPATPSLSHVATEGCRLRGADRNWQVHGQTAAPALSHALVISIVEDAVARLVTEDAVTLVGTLSWDSAGKYSIGEKYSRNPEGG